MSWSSAHGDGVVRLPDEAVMITGVGKLVELQATVRYSIRRDEIIGYLFDVRDPDEIIRGATEAVLRETVASRPFLALLTTARGPRCWRDWSSGAVSMEKPASGYG
jgi:Cu+-exporting ATPase